ncbi:hypothetical protein H0H87_006382 [Tephrocybe sp. NHM501043]|nr:hypothetical protein H0H87_006382 [Tephrocybe sp. NHM501043]
MDPPISPEPHISVLQPEEADEGIEVEASIDMDQETDFPTEFLNAQTRSFRQEALGPDQPMDWDNYVVSSAADCASAVGSTNTSSLDIGNQISDICAYLIDVFSDLEKYTKFLSYRGEAAQDLLDLLQKISDIAAGMEYLHRNGVVHGDLKGLNVLVTDLERACLADFGLSYVSDAGGLKGHALSSNHADAGTQGFEAPELVDPEAEFTRKTEASDVYAFGMVCYELLAGERPFGNVRPLAVVSKIMGGQYPPKPVGRVYLERGLTDDMWSLMQSSWSKDPTKRPTATQIVQRLPQVQMDRPNESWSPNRRPGFETSGGQPDRTITNALAHLQSLVV